MASELQTDYLSGKVVYFLVRTAVGTIWNGSAFETYVTANYATYDIAATEQGTASAYYAANMPALSAGVYYIVAKERIGGSPAETDPSIGWGVIQWQGTVTMPLSNLASGQLWLASGMLNLQAERTLTYNTSGAGTPSANSLYTVVQMMNFADTTTNSGKLTVFKPDGTTEFVQKSIAILSGAAAITRVN